MKPKTYTRSLMHPQPAPKYCANCGAKISAKQIYCDDVCRREHSTQLKLERRPKDLQCAHCQKPLDPLSREPRHWRGSTLHFCDAVCTDAYRREHGTYQAMSQQGGQKIREYMEKHGQPQNYEERAEKTSEANRTAPPKAKHFVRHGRAWGYDVIFYPNETDDGYDASVVGLEELGVIHCHTVKAGLLLIRRKITESRQS